MPSDPPFDRAVALACSLRTFHDRWLSIHCGACRLGSALIPIKLMLAEQPARAADSLADVVIRLRCQGCKARPAVITLLETHYGHLMQDSGGPRPHERGWRLELRSG